jgi:RNA polymerase sigma-70 factor (ECF subfamily)
VTTASDPRDDRAWFADTVVALLPDLLATARRLTRNQSDAEDLAAEAVARAWTALGSLDDRARIRGWIFRILTNLYISQLRARGRKPDEEPLPDAEETFSLFERLHQPFLLWWSTPEQEFLDKLVREDFARALDALPDAFRVVVVLADLRGLAYEEIANQLGVPIGTVRSRLARGRARLQKALWVHACDAGLRPSAQPPPAPGA